MRKFLFNNFISYQAYNEDLIIIMKPNKLSYDECDVFE